MKKPKFKVGDKVIYVDKSYKPHRFGWQGVVIEVIGDKNENIAVVFENGERSPGLKSSRYVLASKLSKALL